MITHAGPEHIAGICAVVNACALEGTTLPITADEVALGLGQFVVAERDGQILSCGALVVFSPAMAEVRSIAVSPAARGTGLGAAVVRRLIDEANSLELDQLVLLTKVPDFFGRLGFISASPEDLPEEYLTIQIHARGRTLNGRTAMRMHLM
ncbi:MAG: GNAT family N-acetyltransferase [Phycisphaerales bacterium JB039]